VEKDEWMEARLVRPEHKNEVCEPIEGMQGVLDAESDVQNVLPFLVASS